MAHVLLGHPDWKGAVIKIFAMFPESDRSKDADLVLVGLRGDVLRHRKIDLFGGHDQVRNVLFINRRKEISLDREVAEDKAETPDEARDDSSTAFDPSQEGTSEPA